VRMSTVLEDGWVEDCTFTTPFVPVQGPLVLPLAADRSFAADRQRATAILRSSV
jgi:hypothetical protein